MKCPFVNSVSKGLFQRSNLSLSGAINHCPYINQARSFHDTVPPPAQIKIFQSSSVTDECCGKKQVCPYTNGKSAPGPMCPITGIDVSRIVHR
jgi:hypothetical protein